MELLISYWGDLRKYVSASLILLCVALGVALTKAPTVNAAEKALIPRLCSQDGPILVRAFPSKVNLRTCPIQGRLLVSKGPNGQSGPAIHVPPPGRGYAAEMLTTAGEYALSALNAKGWVTIHWATPSTASIPASSAPQLPASTDPACNETGVNYEGAWWANAGTPTDVWYYNESTASRAGLTVSATESDIQQAVTNLTQGINNCGYAEQHFGVRGSFQGNTSLFANIDSSASCTSKFPDGQSTVSWGSFDSNHSTVLAETCYTYASDSNGTNAMTEADIYIGSNRNIVHSFPANCTDSYDLQSVVIHEWGHAFGLAHESSGQDEVMYPYKFSCVLRRHLGNGDWTGMAILYPYLG